MNMNNRRLRSVIAALAALSALTACASQTKNDTPVASPSATASATPSVAPTTTPEQVQAFCNSLIAFDAGVISMGPPEDEEEPSATASPSASAMAGHDMSSSSDETAEPSSAPSSMPSSMPTGAPEGEAGGPPSFPDVVQAMGPVVAQLETTKTKEIAPQADALITLLRKAVDTKDRDVLDSDEFGAAAGPVKGYGVQNCGYKTISTAAVEYEYDTLPSTASAGKTTVTLKNDGKEFHELVLLKIADGVTDRIESIMELPEEQLFSKAFPALVTFSPPGQSSSAFIDLKPGRYSALCFLPKGLKPGSEPAEDAPPHFTEGMLEEIVVS